VIRALARDVRDCPRRENGLYARVVTGGTDGLMALDALLVAAKLSVPQASPGAVSRTPLIVAARVGGRRVVGITTPAGHGKSTLLALWAGAEDRRVAWVSLDQLDDDPATPVTLLASAYRRISPDHADRRGRNQPRRSMTCPTDQPASHEPASSEYPSPEPPSSPQL
jgi:hypothetical protein